MDDSINYLKRRFHRYYYEIDECFNHIVHTDILATDEELLDRFAELDESNVDFMCAEYVTGKMGFVDGSKDKQSIEIARILEKALPVAFFFNDEEEAMLFKLTWG